jgi:hypothetical protein
MIEALIAGERDPARLADLAKGRLRVKIPDLVRALHGRFGAITRCFYGCIWTTSTTSTRLLPRWTVVLMS